MKRVFICITLLLFESALFSQDAQTDSLKKLLLQAKEDTSVFSYLLLISYNNTWKYSDTALLYGQKALLVANKLDDPEKKADALCQYGEALRVTGNYPLAIEYLLKGIHIEENNKPLRVAVVSFGKPILKILYYYLIAAYSVQGNFQQAAFYYYRKEKAKPALFNNDNMEDLFLLSTIYENSNQTDSALLYAEKAQDYDLIENGKRTRTPLYINLGDLYFKKKNFSQALKYYHIAEQIHDFSYYINTVDMYNGMARIFAQINLLDSGIHYAQKAIDLRNRILYPLGRLESYQILSDLYKKNGQYDSALNYMEKNNELRNTFFNQQIERDIQNISFNEKLHQQELIAQDKQQRNNIKIITAIMIAVILFITVILFWRNIEHRKKAFNLLEKQKLETENEKNNAENTLARLKLTQSQLIQSEKMASLGELTAGIAHEIQNPLNFVNNFSEVSNELLAEMKDEFKKGDTEEGFAIADDIKQNLEKILHHGKRADAIVKGMLQHSRSSSGQKEPTNINALADEYLRLAYHGLKAKDNSFNATMKTEFDETIGNINVIPHDIGRVILNLINNAFYAASQNFPSGGRGAEHEPTVWVSTKKVADKILISLKDNGPGIPQKILDKIFQPFFTTKPTGQGTGLGLSLSYDIIKAHGGEIKVNTRENEGTEFTIVLPA